LKNKKSARGGFFVSVWLQLGSRERANPPNAIVNIAKVGIKVKDTGLVRYSKKIRIFER